MLNQERLLATFKELCLIDAPSLKERNCADYVLARLQALGIECHEDDAASRFGGNAGNIIAKIPGTVPGAKTIFLSAHMDTVEPTAGLKIIEEDGVLKSDGSTILGADDKGGLAPILEAMQVLQEQSVPHGPIVLLITIGEEIGLLGAQHVKIEDLNIDYGFVLDTGPPVGSFVNRTATHDNLEFLIEGKPAHSGKEPEKGINAIQVASDAVMNMRLGRIGPETTANIGIVSGGTAVNVVCPSVTLKAEARSTDLAELDKQVAHMIQVVEDAARRWGAKATIKHDRHYKSYHIPEDSEVVKVALAASRNLGMEAFLRTNLGGSDANIYNARGVPSVVVATGMDRIHTHEESIKIADLCDTTTLLIRLVIEASEV